MLKIYYLVDGTPMVKKYETTELFLAAQYRDKPDLEAFFPVVRATIGRKEIDFPGQTVHGLFNHLRDMGSD